MRHIALAFCSTSLVLTGCDADCGDPARIDGLYTVQSNVVSEDWVVTGYAEDDFEWQNSRRLALENMRKVNGDVMREHATAALAASMVTSEDPGAL